MASQRQFEGPVLEDVLARVRAEVGPDARIVAANRVRKGGVGGFFARQAFEVLVEPADATPRDATSGTAPTGTTPTGTTPADAMPTGLLTTEAPAASPAAFGRASAPRTEAPIRATAPTATSGAQAETRAPTSILELADAVSEHERNDVIDLVEELSVSTESRDFAQVLERFSQSIDATPEELAGNADPAGDIDLRDPSSSPRPAAATTTAPPPLPAAAAQPAEPAQPERPPVDPFDLRKAAPSAPRMPAAPPRTPRPSEAATEVIDRYETKLVRLGVPARLIPRGTAPNALKGALVESLTRLPHAPSVPLGLGVVIAVVGDGAAPIPLARDLATELGLDPDDVVLATHEHLGFGIPTWLQVNDAATAQERRLSWRRRTRPTIVACSLPADPRGLNWAREILDDLEPTIIWAIVDASAKREDLAYRLDALGGVDVLALDRLDDTVSPASVLDLGIPVGRLAQEHASPLTWTELLMERMSS